jgi:hypothetical protein
MTYTGDVDKASAQLVAPVARGSVWYQTVHKTKLFVGSFEFIFVLLKEGSILHLCYEIWGVTVLIIIGSVNYRVVSNPPPPQPSRVYLKILVFLNCLRKYKNFPLSLLCSIS